MHSDFIAGFEKRAEHESHPGGGVAAGAGLGALVAHHAAGKPYQYFRVATGKSPAVIHIVNGVKSSHKAKAIGGLIGGLGAAAALHASREKQAEASGTNVHYIHAKDLSDDEFSSLKDSIKHVGDRRKAGETVDWRQDAMNHFAEKHPHLKGKLRAGGTSRMATKHSGEVVVAAKHNGAKTTPELHAHGQYAGGEPGVRFTHYFKGTHEKVAGRVDRFLKALKKQPKLLSQAHVKVRAKDLSDQFRGIAGHTETSLEDAAERVKKTQAKGGFRGTSV